MIALFHIQKSQPYWIRESKQSSHINELAGHVAFRNKMIGALYRKYT